MPPPLLPPVDVPGEDAVSAEDDAVPVSVLVAVIVSVACVCDVASVGITVEVASDVDEAVCALPKPCSKKLQSTVNTNLLRILSSKRVDG